MAQCAELNQLNIVIKKNIEVRNFSRGGLSSSVTFEHDGTEPLFNVEVYPNGRNAGHGDYVSVMVNRCWFYPHLIHGVVYGSLGWTASVVDAEGQERFHAYFGNDDFLSLVWAEDFFRDHEFGLEMFVKRSVLLDDPAELLPDDVLTVCCEVFYECRTGDAAMLTRGEEINKFLVKAFTAEMVELSNPAGSVDECGGNAPVAMCESTTSILAGGVPRPPVSYDAKCWRKSLRMMNESLDELEGAFELYTKLQKLKDVREQNPQLRDEGGESTGLAEKNKVDKDFRQDIEKAAGVFKTLRENSNSDGGTTKTEDQNDPEHASESNIAWWDESDGVVKVTHQLVRILALHKHLQMRFENCKRWYKEAAERMKACRKRQNTDTIEEDITEIFSLYNETREAFGTEADRRTNQDYLLPRVSRFLTVFLNTLRVLALRLYFPVCVLQAPPPEVKLPDSDDTQKEGNEIEPTDQDSRNQDSTFQKLNTNEELPVSNSGVVSEDIDPILEAQHSNNTNEKWNFTIETSDGKVLDVPFEEGQTTLGSLIRAASPVFDRMLDTPMLEKTQRRLKLDDTDYNTLCHFVSYIQTGEISTETLDNSSLLYRMAHKYQVPPLLRACVERMSQLMSHLNADDVGAFSQFFEDDMLMSLVEAHGFRSRATMAVMGLQELNVSPLSSESTWSHTIGDVPIVEKAIEHIVPKEDYDFYN